MNDDDSTRPTHTAMLRDPTPDPAGDALVDDGILPAQQVGHYQVLGSIGQGGMGEVYAAYDPKLNRRVALKVLHPHHQQRDQQRLVGEAQALARLAHPNVVSVHDVGAHGEQLFVAMEYVQGVTLREWARAHPPGSPERLLQALDVLLQAGEGLRAAHKVGLVHRDFKPSNVLVGDDGRVRVVDFGLARAQEPSDSRITDPEGLLISNATPDPHERSPEVIELAAKRTPTQTGVIVGTPAYMAPEQFRELVVNATSDQFGFCMTAWEVLFGQRPFEFRGAPAYLREVRRAEPQRAEGTGCPEVLDAALRKGLAFYPRRRHADMDVVLDKLREARAQLLVGTPPRRRLRRLWVAALAVAGATTVTALALRGPRDTMCTGAEARLRGVWDDKVRTELEAAFVETKVNFAADAWAAFAPRVDAYATTWTESHRDACQAAQVRKEQSTELMDLRMACLESRRGQLGALTSAYAQPNMRMLERAAEVAEALSPVDRCEDPQYVRNRGRRPSDDASAARATRVEQLIARARTSALAGDLPTTFTMAEEALAEATDLELDPLIARALSQRGIAQFQLGRTTEAKQDLERAYILAKETEQTDVALRSSRWLLNLTGTSMLRFSEAQWWTRAARQEADALNDPTETARLLLQIGNLEAKQGNPVMAVQNFEESLDILRTAGASGTTTYAHALSQLGGVHLTHDQGAEIGLGEIEQARSIFERELGPNHPSSTQAITRLARAHRILGHPTRSRALVQEAVRRTETTFGPNHRRLAFCLMELAHNLQGASNNTEALAVVRRTRDLDQLAPLDVAATWDTEGNILANEGDHHGVERVLREALKIRVATVGPTHPQVGRTQVMLGHHLMILGRATEALALTETGLALGIDTLSTPDAAELAGTYDHAAETYRRAGQLERAAEFNLRSREVLEKAYGKDSSSMIPGYDHECEWLFHIRKLEQARAACARALELSDMHDVRGGSETSAHNNMGAVLMEMGRLDEAIEHYEQAREGFTRLQGPRSLWVAITVSNIAEIHALRGEPQLAYDLYAESVKLREEQLGATHPSLAVPLIGMSDTLLVMGNPADAERAARRAMAATAVPGTSPMHHARAQAALARVLWARPVTRRRADEVAQHARETFEDHPDESHKDIERLDQWLRTRTTGFN